MSPEDPPPCMDAPSRARFDALVMPHLDAAYNLARWLARNDDDACDIVQEAFLRAMRSIHALRGDQARPWLLAIVRNTAWTWLGRNRDAARETYDPDLHDEIERPGAPPPATPETELARLQDRAAINEALARLPIEMREAVVLRELEDLSYREIAQIQRIPLGTVMSRLSRGRQLLQRHLRKHSPGVVNELH